MYRNEHDVANIINEFANINSPVKIHSYNDKCTLLDDAPITCNVLSKLTFQLFLQLFYNFLNDNSWQHLDILYVYCYSALSRVYIPHL